MSTHDTLYTRSDNREWIQTGDDPETWALGRRSSRPDLPPVVDQLAVVRYASAGAYRWETYRDHSKGVRPGRVEAFQAAESALIHEANAGLAEAEVAGHE